MSFRPFYVLGEVQKPGEYPYRAGLNVLSAIAIAGGATYRASTSEVHIQRAGTTNLQKFAQSPTVAIMPGDFGACSGNHFLSPAKFRRRDLPAASPDTGPVRHKVIGVRLYDERSRNVINSQVTAHFQKVTHDIQW
jgi:SLBB domain